MTTIDTGPSNWVERVRSAPAGATVRLLPGDYPHAVLAGIQKSAKSPVTIDGGGVTFSGGKTLKAFRQVAAETAQLSHRYGTYPGVYPIAGDATLRIVDCCGLVFSRINFVDSWPTAVYIKRCTDLRFEDMRVTGSSYAFYAVEKETARLVLRRCKWLQDPTGEETVTANPERNQLWRTVPWREIHERYKDNEIDQYNGNRAYDGTFFLGRDIAGDVEIDDCTVLHAFNGVHLFNRDLDPRLSRNIHVHHCRFRYIRDNVLEPENMAFNWWFHDNELFNCHKPFSLELPIGGWLYVFRNRAWFDAVGGPESDQNTTGAILKLLDHDRLLLRYAGPVHFFNNSWFTRSPIAKSGSIARLAHHNNAIVFCNSGEQPEVCPDPSVFGKFDKPDDEHFTTNWGDMRISFFNDIVNHLHWTTKLRARGYPLSVDKPRLAEFVNPRKGEFALKTGGESVARKAGRAVEVELPGAPAWRAPEPFNVGWYQDDERVFAGLKFCRIPDDLPSLFPTERTKSVPTRNA